MPAQKRNCFAIWVERLRPRFYRGGGKVHAQVQLVNVVSAARSYKILACEAKDFKLFAGQYNCSDELGIAVDVMRLQRFWTSVWGLMTRESHLDYSGSSAV